MRKRRAPPRILGIAAVSVLVAPLLGADGKPEVPRGPYRADPGIIFEEPGEAGWGKGTVLLPTFQHEGILVGVLCDNAGEAVYALDAMMTGCIPSKSVEPGPHFWFGGLYGTIHEDGGGFNLIDKPAEPGLRVEGTWWLLKSNQGRFSAEIWGCNAAGIEYVCGVVEGKFDVAEPGEEPLVNGPTALRAAIGPETKAGHQKHSPYRGVEPDGCICPVDPLAPAVHNKARPPVEGPYYRPHHPTKPRPIPAAKHLLDRRSLPDGCICPVDPWSPAVPPKEAGPGEDPWEAEGGLGKYHIEHKNPMPYPQHPDFRGVVDPPEPLELAGTFALRYQLFE